ncbi:MAG: SHOCT domain-containing protein [Clostridia bacterium]|nr:SHOCT domain-containing protein [Clostridia bacterium]
MQRQEDAKKQIVSSPVAESTSNADELKKYKELLDSGVITQEEFDAKKKQLLGL